jgi:microcystin-dependent protein
MMARLAEWRDDVSGTIATAGSSTAYTVASNQGFDNFADMNGAMIAFVPHTTNGATVTLNVDGLGGKPLRSAPSVELPAGVMVQGTPYVVTYNNSDGAFYLQGFTINPYQIPIGGLLPYIGSSAPNSAFVLPFGQAISRTTYATLFSLVSTTFGVGDGSTTFNVPDVRGRSIFGQDNMGGSAANRITVAGGNFDGTVLGGAGGNEKETLTQAQLPAVAATFSGTNQNWNTTLGAVWLDQGAGGSQGTLNTPGGQNYGIHDITISVTPSGSVTWPTYGSNLGHGDAHPIMPPAMTLPYILRII